MGYPEEDSENKKVETEKIFSDGFNSKHNRSSSLTKNTNYCEVISSKVVFNHDKTDNSEDFEKTYQSDELDNSTLTEVSEVSSNAIKFNNVNRYLSKNNGLSNLCNLSLEDHAKTQSKEVSISSDNVNLFDCTQNLENINGLKSNRDLLTNRKCVVDSCGVENNNSQEYSKISRPDEFVNISSYEEFLKISSSPEDCLKISSPEKCFKKCSPEKCLEISSPEEHLKICSSKECWKISSPENFSKISNPEECLKVPSPEECLKVSSSEECLKVSSSEECLKISSSEECLEIPSSLPCNTISVSDSFTSLVDSNNISSTKFPTESFSDRNVVELNNKCDKSIDIQIPSRNLDISHISENKIRFSDDTVTSISEKNIPLNISETDKPFCFENEIETKELESSCQAIRKPTLPKAVACSQPKYSNRSIDSVADLGNTSIDLPLQNSIPCIKVKRDKGKSLPETKPNYKKCMQKFHKKKLFSSKEIALMKGFPGRCRSISLFNGKFLTRGNVLANQIERFNLGLPKEKLKFIRINNIECCLKQKKVRGRAKKIVKRLKEQNKTKKYARVIPKLDEISTSKKCLKDKSLSLVTKFKNKKHTLVSEKKEAFNLESSNINKKVFGEENRFFLSDTDSNTSNYMNFKDSEKLYSQLIEEASFTDFDSASDKSSELSDNELTGSSIHELEVPEEVAKLPKALSQRQLGSRQRSLNSSAKMNLEVQDQCCGHWFPTKKSFIQHLIEKDADPIHNIKLIDNEMVKCSLCSCWTTINGEKKHLKEKHGIKNINKQDFLTTKVSFKTINSKAIRSRPVSRNSEPERESKEIEQNINRPCPMSKKRNSDTCTTNEIICNLTEDPKASDSVIKIASVSELPNHLKPIIQLSLKENVDFGVSSQPSLVIVSKSTTLPSSLLTSNGIGGLVNDKKNTDKYNSENHNAPHLNLENSRLRRISRGSIKIYSPINETCLQDKNQRVSFSSKNENKDLLKGSRKSRYSMDSSPERIIKNMPVGRIKFKKSLSKRNRILRRNGRRIRRCGFHSSETSDAVSDQSEYDSSENHENDFLDYVDENDNVESIPTVELDLFTIDSYSEEPSVFLTDPTNPNFKVYASMDAIFVGDSALGDVTNQVGYITDGNNVVYVNPSHFLFPKIDEEENSLKFGAPKIKRSKPVKITRKSIKPIKDELQTIDSKGNSKNLGKQNDILALAAESIKGYDKENLTVVDSLNSVNSKPETVPLTSNDDKPLTSAYIHNKDSSDSNTRVPSKICPIKSISTSAVATIPSTVKHPLNSPSRIQISTNTSIEQTTKRDEKAVAKPVKSTIIVKSNLSKRKLLIKSNVKERLLETKDDIIIIKTNTGKQTAIASAEIDPLMGTNVAPNIINDCLKSNEKNLSQSHNNVAISPKEDANINNRPFINKSHQKKHVISLEEAIATTLVHNKNDTNISKCHENKHIISLNEVVNAGHSMKTSKITPVICDNLNKEVFSLNSFSPDRINGTRKINTRPTPTMSSVSQNKETDIVSHLALVDKIPSEEPIGYQKDDVISLDDAIASLAPIDKDDIEECFTTAGIQNAIDTVDIADFDSIAISSLNDYNFTIVDPVSNNLKKGITSPCKNFDELSNKAQSIISKEKEILEKSNFFNNFIPCKPLPEIKVNNSTPCKPLPEIKVTCDSQVIVTSAELTPFETLEGGICLEDVLDNNTSDFDLLSMKGFNTTLKNDVTQTAPFKKVELNNFSQLSNSLPEMDSFASSSKKNFSPEIKYDYIPIAESSCSDSSSDELDSGLEPETFSPAKYRNGLDIADVVKGRSLWNTPLLYSPIRSKLAPTIVNTPAKSISKIKPYSTFDQLHDVPLSSIPDLLSPSRDLADKFLKNRPVELSPNTVSSILSPKTYNANDLASPIFNGKSQKYDADTRTKLSTTPGESTKASRSSKKSARKNIMHTPNLPKDIYSTPNLNSEINEDLPRLLFTPSKTLDDREAKANLVESFLSSDLPTNTPLNCFEGHQLSLSPSKSPQNKFISMPSDLSASNSLHEKHMSPTFTPKGSTNKRNSLKSTSFRKMDKVIQPNVSPSISPQYKYLSAPSNLPVSKSLPLKSIDAALSSNGSNNKTKSFKKLGRVLPVFEGFDSPPNSISTEVANSPTSLRMKISLKGVHHAKSEASFNNAPDTPLFTDEDDNVQHEDKGLLSSSSSSSSSSSGSSSSSDSSSSSSDDSSEESDDEHAGESKKIVLTQFDPVSGMRKQTPSKLATCSSNLDERKTVVVSTFDPVSGIRKKTPSKPSVSTSSTLSPILNDSVKGNLNNNTDLTSLKITVREAEKGNDSHSPKKGLPKASKLVDQVVTKNLPHVSPRSKVPRGKGRPLKKRNAPKSEPLGTADPCIVSDQNIVEDRSWLLNNSKLEDQIINSDNQKETSEGGPVNEIVKSNSEDETSYLKEKCFDASPKSHSLKPPNLSNLCKTQSSKIENRDIRSYFSKFNRAPVEQTKSPNDFVEPAKTKSFKSPNYLSASIKKRGLKRKSADSMDIRSFLSPPESLNISASVEESKSIGVKKACHIDQRNLTPVEARKKYEDIIQRSLLNGSDELTPFDYNFEGFKTTFLVSNLRAKLLEEYVDVLKMTWWFHEDRYPVPVDQLCDWDDDQLNSILFENG